MVCLVSLTTGMVENGESVKFDGDVFLFHRPSYFGEDVRLVSYQRDDTIDLVGIGQG